MKLPQREGAEMDIAADMPLGEIVYLFTGIFDETSVAEDVLNEVRTLERDKTIAVIDAAMITKSTDGKLLISETKELTTRKGARRGAVIAGVIALAFPPSLIASVVAGAGIGALIGKVRDSGIKTNQFQRIADQLNQGDSGVLVLVQDSSKGPIIESIRSHDGELLMTDLGQDTSADVITVAASPPWATSEWEF